VFENIFALLNIGSICYWKPVRIHGHVTGVHLQYAQERM